MFFVCLFSFFGQTHSQNKASAALSPLPFQKCWTYDLKSTLHKSVASDNVGQFYIALNNQTEKEVKNSTVEAIDLALGEKLWSTQLRGKILRLFFEDGMLVVLSEENTNLFLINVLSPKTGIIVSSELLQINNNQLSSEADSNSRVKVSTKKILSSILFKRAFLLVSVRENVSTVEVLDNEKVIYGANQGDLYISEPLTKKKNRILKTGGKITSITSVKGYRESFVIASLDNFVYSISADTGRVLWRRRLPGRITEKPLVAGLSLIFTVIGSNSAFILNSQDGKHIGNIRFENIALNRPILSIDNRYIFQTDNSLVAYSNTGCSK